MVTPCLVTFLPGSVNSQLPPPSEARSIITEPGFIADACRLGDHVLQALGLYLTPLHVVGELNLSIRCSAARFESDFGFRFSDFQEATAVAVRELKAQGWPG